MVGVAESGGTKKNLTEADEAVGVWEEGIGFMEAWAHRSMTIGTKGGIHISTHGVWLALYPTFSAARQKNSDKDISGWWAMKHIEEV